MSTVSTVETCNVNGFKTKNNNIIVPLNGCMAIFNEEKKFIGFKPSNHFLLKLIFYQKMEAVEIDFSKIPKPSHDFLKKIGNIEDREKGGELFSIDGKLFIKWTVPNYSGEFALYRFYIEDHYGLENHENIEYIKQNYSLEIEEENIDILDIFPNS